MIPVTHTTWADWKVRHPDTLVLSMDTGFGRDYSRDPYATYKRGNEVMFPVEHGSGLYPVKELIIGIAVNGRFKPYPFRELAKTNGRISDSVAGRRFVIRFGAANRSGTVLDDRGREYPSVIAYWFAWYAFHPHTEIFRARP